MGWLRLGDRLTRRAGEATRAAVVLSLDDERCAPETVLAAARAEYDRLSRLPPPDAAPALRARFGRGAVDALLLLGEPVGLGPEPAVGARVAVGRRPRLRLVAVQSGEAVVGVRTWGCGWLARRRFATALALAPLERTVGRQGPRWKLRRLAAYWVLELRAAGWRFERFETRVGGDHQLERPLDPDAIAARHARDETVLDLAAQERPRRLAVPFEIARSLPYEVDRAQAELVTLDPAFGDEVVEVAVRRALDAWARAAEERTSLPPEIASEAAAAALLEPADAVVRGPELEALRVRRVHALRVPPEITVELQVELWRGRRDPGVYDLEFRRRDHVLVWRLARASSPQQPWRLVDPHAEWEAEARPDR